MAGHGIRRNSRAQEPAQRVRTPRTRWGGVLITDRGRVVAQLSQPTSEAADAAYPGLIRHARAGKVRLGATNFAASYPRVPRSLTVGVAQRLLDEERGAG